MLFKASAPGSLMLLGEYGVLHGKHALVCAVDKRMTVTLAPRQDKKICITSALGNYATDISSLRIEPPFQFILTTLKSFQSRLLNGCDIQIISEFSDKIGFASSAAVTVAILTVVSTWLQVPLSKIQLVQQARRIVRRVQGVGSGADVAACVFGGLILYRASPLFVEELPYSHPLTVIYSGSKTPTVEAIAKVKQNFKQAPSLFQQICRAIDQCVLQGKTAIAAQNGVEFGHIMNIQQGLMDALGVNTPRLNTLVQQLRAKNTILGAKISGAGFGDCVIGWGQAIDMEGSIPVAMTHQGVMSE